MQAELPRHEIVLLGVGHTNAHIVRMWKMDPIPGARLTCLSDFPVATYSGMLPAVLARQIAVEHMEIDLVRLCASSGARLICDPVENIDLTTRTIQFGNRPPLRFDALSIGVGSRPDTPNGLLQARGVVPIKPMQTFLNRLEKACREAAENTSRSLSICIAGGGVGGIEVALALPGFLSVILPEHHVEISIVTRSDELAPGLARSTRQRLDRILRERAVRVLKSTEIVAREGREITTSAGDSWEADVVLWATSAVAGPLLQRLELPRDSRGFLLIDEHLRCETDAPVFAVGDAGSLKRQPTPKAGVYAVRQGPILWENLRRIIAGRELIKFKPQRDFLKLINTGHGKAIGEFHGWSFQGQPVRRWKDLIDQRFMRMYQAYAPMEMPASPSRSDQIASQPPRCLGCGSKVGATVLQRALQRLEIPPSPFVSQGLDRPDDAAFLSIPGPLTAITTDAFPAPLDDEFLTGRIAALNALSDLFAVNAQPFAALANVTVPLGTDRAREDTLHALLSGVLQELRPAGATLIGGHTIEGPRLEIGLTLLGDANAVRSQAPEPGDALLLTKPLGTGVLLAAHMQAACPAGAYSRLLDSMLQSNAQAARILYDHAPHAVTDVTGFGLAGHLRELLGERNLVARLQRSQIPVLPAADRLLKQGYASTLAPANRAIADDIHLAGPGDDDPLHELLFDPQTSGGLLAALPPDRLADCRRAFLDAGLDAFVIGTIRDAAHPESPGVASSSRHITIEMI